MGGLELTYLFVCLSCLCSLIFLVGAYHSSGGSKCIMGWSDAKLIFRMVLTFVTSSVERLLNSEIWQHILVVFSMRKLASKPSKVMFVLCWYLSIDVSGALNDGISGCGFGSCR